MSTKQEIIAALTARARRCDRPRTLRFLAESVACTEAAKAIASVSDYTAPHLWQLFENSRALGRAEALRKQPRPRRASAQHLLRFAQSVTARLRAEQLTQTTR